MDRRRFVAFCAASGLTSTLFPGVLWAQMQPGTKKISLEMVREAARLAEETRKDGITAVVGTGDRSMRARMRQAGASGARLAVIIGDDELREQRATVKRLDSGDQKDVPFADLITYLGPIVRHSDIDFEDRL